MPPRGLRRTGACVFQRGDPRGGAAALEHLRRWEPPMLKIKTPKGTAGYLNLVIPDIRFDPKGKYKANITLVKDDAAKLLQQLKEEAAAELGPKKAAKAKMPGKKNEDGGITFTFKSTSKPDIYDSEANLLGPETVKALRVGSGSTIRVSGEARAYENGANIGVTLYLNEVQIIHLVQYENHGFEPDAGGSFVLPDIHARERGSYQAGGGE